MDMTKARRSERISVLPPSLAPRGLSRTVSAEYVGVSPATFDGMVKQRQMPKPKRIGARTVWDRYELDAAFLALPVEDGDANQAQDAWSDVAV